MLWVGTDLMSPFNCHRELRPTSTFYHREVRRADVHDVGASQDRENVLELMLKLSCKGVAAYRIGFASLMTRIQPN